MKKICLVGIIGRLPNAIFKYLVISITVNKHNLMIILLSG